MPDTLRHDCVAPRSSPDSPAANIRRLRIILRGRVQGLGVRPAIARLAHHLGLAGEVYNSTAGLVIEIEGDATATVTFQAAIPEWLPARAGQRANRGTHRADGRNRFPNRGQHGARGGY